MAQMLRFKDSSGKHLDATRRHKRRCNQVHDAHKFAEAINPQYQALQDAHKQFLDASDRRVDTYDDMVYYDEDLDNGIRTIHEKCNQYDRENPGHDVLHLVFPNGNYL